MDKKGNIDYKTELLHGLEDKVKGIEELIRQNQQEQYVSKLEDLCSALKYSIVEKNMKAPDLATFDRYLKKLTNQVDIIYVVSLIHSCWCFLYPRSLFSKPINPKVPIDDLLKTLKRGSTFRPIFEEADRHNLMPLAWAHSLALSKSDSVLQESFRDYMKGLHAIVDGVCNSNSLTLFDEYFIVEIDLGVKLPKEQLQSVFKALAEKGLVNYDSQTESDFCTLFGDSYTLFEKQIVWNDFNPKTKLPNYASLYVVLRTMGVVMSDTNKSIICKAFVDRYKKNIEPCQLKFREESESLTAVRKIVEDAMASYSPQ